MYGRRVDGRVLTFGVSGYLRDGNLILWDRQTGTLWEQGTGQAVVGALAGARLTLYPAPLLPWEAFRRTYPRGRVLSPRSAGRTPAEYARIPPAYRGYDRGPGPWTFFRRPADPRLPPMERVAGLLTPSGPLAVPFSLLRRERVLPLADGQGPVVLLYTPTTRSPFQDGDEPGSPAGSVSALRPRARGQELSLEPAGQGLFRDRETGSLWSPDGLALEGPLKGVRLERVPLWVGFWFYWARRHPDTAVWGNP